MSKILTLLVFVSLKYRVEKSLLKAHVRFLMKVTVYMYTHVGDIDINGKVKEGAL
jgi:hypothetical protein